MIEGEPGADIIDQTKQKEIVNERRENLDPEVAAYWQTHIDQIKQLQQEVADWKRQALEDELTGLPNFKCFKEHIQQEVADVANPNIKTESLGVVFMDLNGFNEINNTYGHDTGDEVLKSVAELLTNTKRNLDEVFRIHGDELLIVLAAVKKTKLNQAFHSFRNRINQALSEPMLINGHEIPVSISMGMSTMIKGGKPKNWMKLKKEADLSMYKDKTAYKKRMGIETRT